MKKIEIKSRYGDVLYVAKGAADVRAALEEAVSRGANLRDAYLRDANLRDANLRDANLRDANLRGANLRDANLRDANLRGANLRGANLRGANLRDANLRDANLRGANLGDAYLRGANLGGANLGGANLGGANLRGAYLGGANLRGAYLRDANLRGANLGDAYLGGANLGGANLGGAYLRDAKGLTPERANPLLILKAQVGKIRAYKWVNENYESPMRSPSLKYEVGTEVKAKANTNDEEQCAAGVNVATLDWCLANMERGGRVMLVEFNAADIAAIPIGDGKFRVHKCKVVKEVDIQSILDAEEKANAKAQAEWDRTHPEQAVAS